jgi:hypothetical protein
MYFDDAFCRLTTRFVKLTNLGFKSLSIWGMSLFLLYTSFSLATFILLMYILKQNSSKVATAIDEEM